MSAGAIFIHDPDLCAGEPCCWHNPSEHHMVDWPKIARCGPFDFRGPNGECLTERTCPHGIGHPDPDSLAYLERVGVDGFGVHGCDGCCAAPSFPEGS